MLRSLFGQLFFSISIAVLSRKSSDVLSSVRSVGSWVSASKGPTVFIVVEETSALHKCASC